MTKMIIGFLAIVLGVTGSVLTAAPKKKLDTVSGYVYVRSSGGGYRKINSGDYSAYKCIPSTSVCCYYVTAYGAGIVVNDWYSDADIANFEYGYNAKIKYIPTATNEPHRGIYEDDEPIWDLKK